MKKNGSGSCSKENLGPLWRLYFPLNFPNKCQGTKGKPGQMASRRHLVDNSFVANSVETCESPLIMKPNVRQNYNINLFIKMSYYLFTA